MFSAVDSGFTL